MRKLNNLHSRSRKYSTKGNRGRYRAIIVPRCELYYSLRILSSYLGNQRAYAAKFNEFASRASCSFEGRNFSIPSGKRERERGENKQAFKTVFHFPLINFPRKYFPVGFHSKEKKVIIIITKTIASKILKTLLILSFLSKKSVIDQKRNVNPRRVFWDEEDRSMTINSLDSKNRLMSPS